MKEKTKETKKVLYITDNLGTACNDFDREAESYRIRKLESGIVYYNEDSNYLTFKFNVIDKFSKYNKDNNYELPELSCRVCHKNLAVKGIARVNDYIVLRHPECKHPICLKCALNKPDKFYIAFKKGTEQYDNLRHKFSSLVFEHSDEFYDTVHN